MLTVEITLLFVNFVFMSQMITEEKKDILEKGVLHRQSYVYSDAPENQETVNLLKSKLNKDPVSIPVDKVSKKNTNRPRTANERLLKNIIYAVVLFILDRISFLFTFSFIFLSTLSGLCLLLAFSSMKIRKFMKKTYNFFVLSFKTVFFVKSVLLLSLIMIVANFFLYFFKDWRMLVLQKLFIIWANALFTFLESYFPNPVYVSYDPKILKMKKSIIISNHTSDYDWLFLMVLLYRMGRFKDMCIMLKQELQEVPVFGHAMNVLGFIFLVRNIEYDKDIIHKGVMKLKNKDSYDLLIFPEGTYITSKTYKRTMEYLEQNKMYVDGELYKPKNSLAPKTTGFNLLLDDLKDDIDGVIDVTMLTTPYTQYPSEVHTFEKIFMDKTGGFNSALIAQHIPRENVEQNNHFIYKLFNIKDNIVSKHDTELNGGNFADLSDFIEKSKKIGVNVNNNAESLQIKSRWKVLLYAIFIILEVSQAYCLIDMFFK